MIVHHVPQRSPEWFALRLGRLTSSCANDMLAQSRDKKGESASRRNLRLRLVLERITGRSLESGYLSPAMRQGEEREADALLQYEIITGRFLTRVGFVSHDTLMAGCSPDGIVGDFEGLVEAKSPIPATHLEFLRTGKVPLDYWRQMLQQMFITGAEWVDYCSWQPDFPEPLRMRIVRCHRDDQQMRAYALMVETFLTEVENEAAEIQRMAA